MYEILSKPLLFSAILDFGGHLELPKNANLASSDFKSTYFCKNIFYRRYCMVILGSCRTMRKIGYIFLLGCSRLNSVRQKYLEKIRSILCGIDVSISHQIMTNQKLLMQLLMDWSKLGVFDSHYVEISTFEELESVSRNICYALHSKIVQFLSL